MGRWRSGIEWTKEPPYYPGGRSRTRRRMRRALAREHAARVGCAQHADVMDAGCRSCMRVAWGRLAGAVAEVGMRQTAQCYRLAREQGLLS
jgi:hypothetical protein